MRTPAQTRFAAVFHAEVLLNSKRIAPYAMAVLFGANAWLWTAKGPAVYFGWATNNDYSIIRNFIGFSFLTLPLFTAVIMGDPVIRDLRAGVTPLIYSKPVSRATYLLGKFFGNFFVLVCCQLAFVVTLVALQAFPTSEMVVQPLRLTPYLKHFVVLVVCSHMVIAAVHFTVGTLSRNPKIVYLIAVSFYPVYAAYQVLLLKRLSPRWRVALDPLLMNWDGGNPRENLSNWENSELINRLVFNYNVDVMMNRAFMILVTVACLAILYARFSKVEQSRKVKDDGPITTMNLITRDERLYQETGSISLSKPAQLEIATPAERVAIPRVNTLTEGFGAKFKQFRAALDIEFRLLYAERSLVALAPLATLLCVVGLAYYEVVPGGSYSATYAAYTAESLLLFLCAIAVFYTGEAMHRDRELRIEPVLWCAPVPNSVLLLSKMAATLLLSICLTVAVGATSMALQIYKGHTPVEVSAYLVIYAVILVPTMIFLVATAAAFNVLLRDKYLAYAASFAVGGGLFYLYSQGYNHWLYNPTLYGLWTASDLTGDAKNIAQIIAYRIYALAVAAAFVALAHLFFERRSARVSRSGRHG